jgi:hypothetical protein
MFSDTEFEIALKKTRKDHPLISDALAESVMKKFVLRWESNRSKALYERVGFGQLIRLTLNELCINGKDNRQKYAALIGHYYSAHAAYVKARQKESGQVQQKPKPLQTPIGVIQSNNGQFAWQL